MAPIELKTTSDPWRIYNSRNGKILKNWRVIDNNGQLVATIANCPVGDMEVARAAIIVNSPEMFHRLTEAQHALRKALPYVPADNEAHQVGEVLDSINELLSAMNQAF